MYLKVFAFDLFNRMKRTAVIKTSTPDDKASPREKSHYVEQKWISKNETFAVAVNAHGSLT